MKILHFIYSLNVGGGSGHVIKLLQNLPSDYEQFVIGISGSNNKTFEELIPNNFFPCNNIIELVINYVKIIKKNKIDKVHLHGRGAGIVGRIISSHKSKLIYTVHGFSLESINFIKKYIYLKIEKKLFKKTEKIIFVSESEMENFYEHTKLPLQKNVIIHNFLSNDILFSRKKYCASQKVKLLYIGRCSYEKGLDILISAWGKKFVSLNNCVLDIIGDGPEKNKYQNKVYPNINFLGTIKNASSLITNYDAVVMPSRHEGMPYVMIETISKQKILICTPARGLKDFINNNNGYVSKEITSQSFFEILEEFFQDYFFNTKVIEKKILKSQELFNHSFNKKIQLEKLQELYRTCGHI